MRIVDSSKASSGLTLVLGGFGANFVLYLMNVVLSRVGVWGSPAEVFFQLCWLGTAAVLAAGLVQVAMAVDAPGLVWATVALIAINAVLDLGFRVLALQEGGLSMLGGLSLALTNGSMLLSLIERGCIIWVLASLAMPRHAWAIVVGGLVMLLSLVRMSMQFAMSSGLVSAEELYSSGVYPVVMPLIGFINSLSMVLIAFAALKSARESVGGVIPLIPPTEHGLHGPPVVDAPASPMADFAIGGVVLLIGIGVTVVSAQAASNGGRYVVATGAIAVGVVRIIRGFVRLARR